MGFKTVIGIIILTFFLVLGAYGIEKGLDKLSERSSTSASNFDNVDSITSNSTGLDNINVNSENSNTDSVSDAESSTSTSSTDSATNTNVDTSTNNTNTDTSTTTGNTTNTSNDNETSDTSPDPETTSPVTHTVSIIFAGFSPSTLIISSGDTVIFVNDDSSQHWPASNRHPIHTDYPGSGISKCGSSEEDSIFDSCGGIAPGDSYQFQFNDVGTWEYHDHLKPGLTGVVEVS